MSLKLFLIRQKKNTGWNTYDSAVVAAPTAEDARFMHPDEDCNRKRSSKDYHSVRFWLDAWADPKDVYVEYIGEAADDIIQSVVCASYNAG